MQVFTGNVLKTAVGATPPWVRIPPLPPITNGKIYEYIAGEKRTKRFAADAKSEQNASNNVYTVPKIVPKNRADSGSRSPNLEGGR